MASTALILTKLTAVEQYCMEICNTALHLCCSRGMGRNWWLSLWLPLSWCLLQESCSLDIFQWAPVSSFMKVFTRSQMDVASLQAFFF